MVAVAPLLPYGTRVRVSDRVMPIDQAQPGDPSWLATPTHLPWSGRLGTVAGEGGGWVLVKLDGAREDGYARPLYFHLAELEVLP